MSALDTAAIALGLAVRIEKKPVGLTAPDYCSNPDCNGFTKKLYWFDIKLANQPTICYAGAFCSKACFVASVRNDYEVRESNRVRGHQLIM